MRPQRPPDHVAAELVEEGAGLKELLADGVTAAVPVITAETRRSTMPGRRPPAAPEHTEGFARA